jgi:hypothetical protein
MRPVFIVMCKIKNIKIKKQFCLSGISGMIRNAFEDQKNGSTGTSSFVQVYICGFIDRNFP